MFINTLIDAIRNRLFLNVTRKIIREENAPLFEELRAVFFQLKEEQSKIFSSVIELKDVLNNQFAQNSARNDNILRSISDSKNVLHEQLIKNLARADDIYYNAQVLAQVPTVHKYFSQFKRINEGKDVVVIGSGPSLNNYKPLKDAINVGINGTFRVFKKLNYLFLTDYVLLDTKLNEEIDIFCPESCKKFYCILPQRRLQVLNQFFHFTERIPQSNLIRANAFPVLLEDIWHGKLAVDLTTEAFGDWGGSVFSALQFVMYTHPKRVFLVGQDCTQGYSYNSDIEKEKLPNHEAKIEWFKSFKDFADKMYPDTEIISVNPVGLKGIFKDWYQDEGEEPNF